MKITVRKARVEDARGLARVKVETWRACYQGLIDDEFLQNRTLTDERVANMEGQIREADGVENIVLTAEDEQKRIIGVCWGGQKRDDHAPCRKELRAIYVLPEFQGQGAGQLLFEAFRRWAAEPFYLFMLKGNEPAAAFYLAQGGQRSPEFDKEQQIGNKLYQEEMYVFC